MKRMHSHRLWYVVLTVGGASAVSLIGGIGIEAVSDKLLPLVPLLVALPALNTMVGDYSTIIAAHAGDPFERARTKRELLKAIAWSVAVNIVGVLLLSIALSAYRGFAFSDVILVKFVFFVAVAIVVSVSFMFFITFLLDKLLEKRRINPDDILIPIVTSVSDVIMLGMIAFAAYFVF